MICVIRLDFASGRKSILSRLIPDKKAPSTAGSTAGGEPFRVLPLDGLPWARLDVLASSFTINLLALAMPIVILQTYDRIVPNDSRDTLFLLVAGVAGALVLDALLRLGRSYVTGWAAARFEHRLGCSMVDRLLSADLVAYERSGQSDGHIRCFVRCSRRRSALDLEAQS